jgi:hypothetical protein
LVSALIQRMTGLSAGFTLSSSDYAPQRKRNDFRLELVQDQGALDCTPLQAEPQRALNLTIGKVGSMHK